jgi:hypothetical protein
MAELRKGPDKNLTVLRISDGPHGTTYMLCPGHWEEFKIQRASLPKGSFARHQLDRFIEDGTTDYDCQDCRVLRGKRR